MKRILFLLLIIFIFVGCKKKTPVVTNPDPKITIPGKVLFLSRRTGTGNWQLFSINGDGTNEKLIISEELNYQQIAVSSDQKRLALLVSNPATGIASLYTMDVDGQNKKVIASGKNIGGVYLSWSNNGKKLMYVRSFTESDGVAYGAVYTINDDGTNETKLTSFLHTSAPQFGPNDSYILYCSNTDRITNNIFKMKTDGSNKQLLSPPSKNLVAPVISPDGTKVLLQSSEYGLQASQLFLMDVDGGNLKQLTYNTFALTQAPQYGYESVYNNLDAVWSADGSKIVFTTNYFVNAEIATINADGSGYKVLTNSPLNDENPIWANDGKHILFLSRRNITTSGIDIYLMPVDGGDQTALTSTKGDDILPIYFK